MCAYPGLVGLVVLPDGGADDAAEGRQQCVEVSVGAVQGQALQEDVAAGRCGGCVCWDV